MPRHARDLLTLDDAATGVSLLDDVSDAELRERLRAAGISDKDDVLRAAALHRYFRDTVYVSTETAPWRCSCLPFALHAQCEHTAFVEGLAIGAGPLRNFAWRRLTADQHDLLSSVCA